MSQDQIGETWENLKATFQEKWMLQDRWDKFTNDDLEMIQCGREHLNGKLQEHYGLAKKEAEKQATAFWKSVKLGDHDGHAFGSTQLAAFGD